MLAGATLGRHQFRAAVLFVTLFALSLASPTGVAAQQSSTLEQQLLEPECIQANNCEMEAPTIDEITINGNKPIVKGTYDSAFSQYLRIIFGSRVYTLGVDDELSATGVNWTLSLGRLAEPLEPGAYEFVVETEGYDGSKKRAETIIVLSPTDQPGTPPVTTGVPYEPTPEESADIPRPLPPEEVRRRVSLLPLIVTLASSAVLFLFTATVRWRKGRG